MFSKWPTTFFGITIFLFIIVLDGGWSLCYSLTKFYKIIEIKNGLQFKSLASSLKLHFFKSILPLTLKFL